MFSGFDTIPECDSQPASHPASNVAVAITLNAKASSLKTKPHSVLVFDVKQEQDITNLCTKFKVHSYNGSKDVHCSQNKKLS